MFNVHINDFGALTVAYTRTIINIFIFFYGISTAKSGLFEKM